MIHIFIGTKAQYVKTAPVIQELDRRRINYNLIDSGQHADISKNYREYFRIRQPECFLSATKEDITTVGALILWFTKILVKIVFRPGDIFNTIFQRQRGICLIHGDTPTTLLSALAAKRAGIKVAHLESGLRSYNIFHPFPEELIRIVTMHLSDYLFAPSQWAYDNLDKMKVAGRKYLVSGNTNIDALAYAQSLDVPLCDELNINEPFAVVSIHRAETILKRKRLNKIIDLVRLISQNHKVFFCLHPPTKKQLKKYRLDLPLKAMPGVIVRDLLPYPQFIQAIKKSRFIVTDGGSVQEESYYLNVPCLLMRNRTERMEGVRENVCISEFRDDKINHFLQNIDQFRVSTYRKTHQSPSSEIVDILTEKTPPD
ncbi:MAG: UDP-N-acetylglucosamine 2-epimerase [Candidatus Omnitrophica bacterium]|nr:UDP-N-acetylglucosamine 2-epimerase [Candidatus Omnitrophota bacterium]